MIKLNGVEIKPTIFPDGTSQVWKIDPSLFKDRNQIEWTFENEAELIHVMQLGILTMSVTGKMSNLYMPYLPYARQDKNVSNDSTFALTVFESILNTSGYFMEIYCLDSHNSNALNYIDSLPADKYIKQVIEKTEVTEVCYPDKGAALRYKVPLRTIVLDKTRDQLTGEITGLYVKEGHDFIKGSKILIVDDICDGGRTFIEAKKVLDNIGASEVSLYTTHGIYSKGVGVLKEAGFKHIYNYKGEV